MKSSKPEDIEVMKKVAVIWPNQKTTGAHVNIAGAGVARHAPHRDAAVKFLEYLSSDDAQRYFAEGNNESPAAKGVKSGNPALDALGPYKAEVIDVSAVGRNQQKIQQLLDRAGYK
jgi:iron(III) transport system substrate-binding protein